MATKPAVGQNPYTDPPPIADRRFHEDPVPKSSADFATIMQGRGAPAPRPGHEDEQQAVGRPPDSPPEDPAAVADAQARRAAALAAQAQQMRDEFPEQQPEPAPAAGGP